MTSPPPISIDGYNPYVSGWYLIPGVRQSAVPSNVPGLTSAQISTLNSHTLQALIELVYVRVGNDVLYQGLFGLDQALSATTKTLSVLTTVQNLHNSLETSSLGSFSAWFLYGSKYAGSENYQSNYNSVASAFLGVPIVPDFVFSSPSAVFNGQSYASFALQLANAREVLSSQVQLLYSASAAANPNSLYSTTKKVLSEMPPLEGNTVAWSDAKLWAMDFYGAYNGQDLAQVTPEQTVIDFANIAPGNAWSGKSLSPGRQLGMGGGGSVKVSPDLVLTFSGRMAIGVDTHGQPTVYQINPINKQGQVANPIEGQNQGGQPYADGPYIGTFNGPTRGQAQNAGLFQQNITLAITSCQTTNNSQTQRVQALLYTFQQYYQSASSVLSSLTQLIEQFGQGIRPA